MQVSKSKESILKKIRAALLVTTPVPYLHAEGNSDLFTPPHDDLTVIFAENFTKLDGKFIYLENESDLNATLQQLLAIQQLTKVYCTEPSILTLLPTLANDGVHHNLATCHVAITSCTSLVARTGTIVISSNQHSGRTASVYSPIHIAIAYTNQLVYDVKETLQDLKTLYQNKLPSVVSFASGPSRTADIEKTLVKGIHGPKEVYCIVIESKF